MKVGVQFRMDANIQCKWKSASYITWRPQPTLWNPCPISIGRWHPPREIHTWFESDAEFHFIWKPTPDLNLASSFSKTESLRPIWFGRPIPKFWKWRLSKKDTAVSDLICVPTPIFPNLGSQSTNLIARLHPSFGTPSFVQWISGSEPNWVPTSARLRDMSRNTTTSPRHSEVCVQIRFHRHIRDTLRKGQFLINSFNNLLRNADAVGAYSLSVLPFFQF